MHHVQSMFCDRSIFQLGLEYIMTYKIVTLLTQFDTIIRPHTGEDFFTEIGESC